jgi:hypothetical protein
MKNFRDIDPQVRHEIFAEHLRVMKELDPAIVTMEELLDYDKEIWEPILDEIVVILLEQIRYVLKDLNFEGSAMDWFEKLIDFSISRESRIVVRRFQQTRGITKAFQKMKKTDTLRSKYIAELKKRGII